VSYGLFFIYKHRWFHSAYRYQRRGLSWQPKETSSVALVCTSCLCWRTSIFNSPFLYTKIAIMVFELQCRQLVRFVNDQTVLGIVSLPHGSDSIAIVSFIVLSVDILRVLTFRPQPVINAVIALIELAIMSRLIGKFNHYYAKRPRKYPAPPW
jgi:hypothetical protein